MNIKEPFAELLFGRLFENKGVMRPVKAAMFGGLIVAVIVAMPTCKRH
jgi:hypothetical protein